MGLRLNGCCCMRLHTAGLLHGWLSIVFTIVLIAITTIRIYEYNTDLRNIVLIDTDTEAASPFDIFEWFRVAKYQNGEIIALVIYLVDIFFSVLLIAGISKKKPNMLVPWLVFRGLGLILLIQIAVGILLRASKSNDGEVVVKALLFAFITGIFVWIWIVIYSLFEEIRKKVNTALKRQIPSPVQVPLPYIESGPDNLPTYQMYEYDR